MTETTVATEHVSATERLEDEAPRADARRLGDRTRIVIADDHTIMREGLRSLLEAEPEFEVVGAVDNGRDAVRLASLLKPDLVLMDLAMPHMDGMSAIRELKRRASDITVLVLTMHKTEEHIRAALQAGASGYLLKDAARAELLIAIVSVMRGRFPGSTTFGLRGSVSADCRRWPIRTPVSPATTAGNHAPLGVALKRLPSLSITLTQVVSFARSIAGTVDTRPTVVAALASTARMFCGSPGCWASDAWSFSINVRRSAA